MILLPKILLTILAGHDLDSLNLTITLAGHDIAS